MLMTISNTIRGKLAAVFLAFVAVLGLGVTGITQAPAAHADSQYTRQYDGGAYVQCGTDRKVSFAAYFGYQDGTGARRVEGSQAIVRNNAGTAVPAIMWIRVFANWSSNEHYTDGTTGYSPYTSLGSDPVSASWGSGPNVYAQVQVGLDNGTACAVAIQSYP